MPTLWEILKKKVTKEVPVETTIYNPLGLRKGHTLKIDTLEFEKLNFTVEALRQVVRTIGGQKHFFVDYDVVAQPFDGDPVALRVRLVPVENPDSELSHNVVLFKKIGDCAYDKGFHEGLSYEQNHGEFVEGDAKYWRVNDVKTEWKAATTTLRDLDGSGKIDAKEAVQGKLVYWDFWRETEDAAKNKVLEFYNVEMDGESGFFEFWVGQNTDPQRISAV
jgi:hypothetical protein